MKNFYFVVQIKENNKFYAHMITATEDDDLLSKFEIENIYSVNIFPTKKRAREVTIHLNECYKKHGIHMFYGGENPLF